MRFDTGVAAAEVRHLVGQDRVGLAFFETLQEGQADEQGPAAQFLPVQVHRVLGHEEVVVDATDDVSGRVRAQPAAQAVDARPQRRRRGTGD